MHDTGWQVHDDTLPRAGIGRHRETQRLTTRSLQGNLPAAQHAVRDDQLDPVGWCWLLLTHDQLRRWRRAGLRLRCRSVSSVRR